MEQSTTLNIAFEQARADAYFSSMGDGAIATDEAGIIRRVNQAALEILGYERDEVVGEWFHKIIFAQSEKGEDIELIDRPINKALMTGLPVSEKIYYKTKKNHRFPASTTVSPIVLNRKPVGAIEVFRDVTRDHEVDRMKSDFISIASHQLRTPLAAIKTYTHMLSDGFSGELNDAQQELLRVVLTSTNRMNEIINTLLNISRIESGTIKVEAKQVDIVGLIKELSNELINSAQDKNLDLVFSYPKQKIHIDTDPLLFTEVCANLITNAIKYTPEGGSITVRVSKTTSGVKIVVRDTGYGIPKELHESVFTKFFRSPNVTKYEAGGNGLGLYLAKQLAETIGGEISFKSIENKGTTFTFVCPR